MKHQVIILIYLGGSILHLVKCYSDGNFDDHPEICETMGVRHSSFQPQSSNPPFKIDPEYKSVVPSEVGVAFQVSLKADSSERFRGFMLEARKPGNKGPQGTFSLTNTALSRLQKCDGIDGKAVTQTNNFPKTTITVNWAASESGEYYFRASFIKSHETFWVASWPPEPPSTSAPTSTHQPSSTPAPTSTHQPSSTPAPTSTHQPSSTPAPTSTHQPSSTPAPTSTHQPSSTPAPTSTHQPSSTPAPTSTHQPSSTPAPTSTHQPSSTPAPTSTHQPSSTPAPTSTHQPSSSPALNFTQDPSSTPAPTLTLTSSSSPGTGQKIRPPPRYLFESSLAMHLFSYLFLAEWGPLLMKGDVCACLKVTSFLSLVFSMAAFFLLLTDTKEVEHVILSAVAASMNLCQTILIFFLCGPSHELRKIFIWVLRVVAFLNFCCTIAAIYVGLVKQWFTNAFIWPSILMGIYLACQLLSYPFFIYGKLKQRNQQQTASNNQICKVR